MGSPAQSTSVFSPHLQPTRITSEFASAHLRCHWQKAEYWYGSRPEDTASSQYSFQHRVRVTPRLISSESTFSWSIGNFPECDSLFGQGRPLIAASSSSSGKGHSSPTLRACFSTACTVEVAHPHECAVLAWLTPIAPDRRISLYLTMLFLSLGGHETPFAPSLSILKGKTRRMPGP